MGEGACSAPGVAPEPGGLSCIAFMALYVATGPEGAAGFGAGTAGPLKTGPAVFCAPAACVTESACAGGALVFGDAAPPGGAFAAPGVRTRGGSIAPIASPRHVLHNGSIDLTSFGRDMKGFCM